MKKRHWHRFFTVNFAKFLTLSWRRPLSYRLFYMISASVMKKLRTPFFVELLWWLLQVQLSIHWDFKQKLTLKRKKLNPTKWSNTLKEFVAKLPTNCLSVLDHFVGLALRRLIWEDNSLKLFDFLLGNSTHNFLESFTVNFSEIKFSVSVKILYGCTFFSNFFTKCLFMSNFCSKSFRKFLLKKFHSKPFLKK